jgi:hypothetical protein
MHALAFASDGSKLYLGNDGGVYSTTQITATNPAFTALNSTLATVQFYPRLSSDPTNVAKAIGGTQDNGTDLYSGGLAWNDVVCGDGAATAIDTSGPGHNVCRMREYRHRKVNHGRRSRKLEPNDQWNRHR